MTKMMTAQLAAGSAMTTLAELQGGSGLLPVPANDDHDARAATPRGVPANDDEDPYKDFAWRPSDIYRDEEDGDDDCAAPASTATPDRPRGSGGAVAAVQAADVGIDPAEGPDARRRYIEARLALASSPEHALLLNYFKDAEALPKGNHKYHIRAVLERAGVTFYAFLTQPVIRDEIERLGPLYELERQETSAHVRGSKVVTMLSVARDIWDRMEREGIPAKRAWRNSRHPSHIWWALRFGLPLQAVLASSQLKREFAERIRSGRIKLGDPYLDPDKPSRAVLREARNKVIAQIREDERKGTPVRASSFRGTRIDLDHYLDRAGIGDARVRDSLKRDQTFRHELAVLIRRTGLKPVHIARLDPLQVSYARALEEGEPLLREAYRAENPRAEPGSAREDAWMANQKSYLTRFMRENGRSAEDDAASDFRSEDFATMRERGHTGSTKGNGQYDDGLVRWQDACSRLLAQSTLPATFAGALDAAMTARRGVTAPALAEKLGCSKQLIHAWRRGGSLPTYQNFHLVAGLERLLELPPGTLSSRLPQIRNSNSIFGGRREITMADGSVTQLGGLWRYMHPDAPLWPEERLRKHVEETIERVFGADNAHRVRQRAAFRNDYGLPEEDPTSPIWREWEDLVGFKRGLIDDGRLRAARAEWRSKGTVSVNRRHLSIFVRWLMLDPEKGGLGIEADQICFALLLNHRIVLRYVAWRVLRAAHLEVAGEPIGPLVTATEKQLLAIFADLMEPTYGWLTQSWDRLRRPVPISRTFRMPQIISGKDGIQIEIDENSPLIEVMPQDLVDRCATEQGWKDVATLASAHIRSTGGRFAMNYKLVRNPQLLVMPILKSRQPVAVGLRIVKDALRHLPPIETAPVRHAVDVQKALVFLLLILTVFRSATLRNLTWKADGSGQVRKVGDGWEVVVGAEHFKNCISPELFGPSWNRRDYERSIGNWGGLNELMDHYITTCRPLLLGTRTSDLLLPPPKGRTDWSEHNFNYLVMSFTRKWAVWNPRFGTGVKGVKAFGPHPARNIVATHIVRNHPTEDRWTLASQVLATGIDRVKLNYGWITSRDELAKTDYLYQEASDIAASDAKLY